MNWKEQLKKYEHSKDWNAAIDLMYIVIKNDQKDLYAYICMNYLLMNLLVEEQYERVRHDYYAALLKKYFLESYSKFSINADYLFYTGITAHLSEWYFDIDIVEAKNMIKEALCLQPENLLYKWGYYTYTKMGDAESRLQSINCAKEILRGNSIIDELTSRGSLGEYILEILKYEVGQYGI